MRGISRLTLIGAALTIGASWGCGGAEFVLGSSEDGGTGSSMDATAGSDGGGGANDAGAADTGTSDDGGARDAEAKDAGGKSSDAGDAGATPVDSGGGASDAGFACPSTDPTVIFCSNFDTSSTPPWNWDGAPVYGAATDGVDAMNFLSAPNAFLASNTALATNAGYTLAEVDETSLTSLAGHIDFSFHAYVKTYDATNDPDVPFAQMGVGDATATAASFTMALVLKAGQLRLDQTFLGTDGGEQTQSVTVGPYTAAKWTAVEMLLDRSQPTGWTITIYSDGVSRLVTATPLSPPTASFQVALGILGVLPPSSANAVEFDNVAVRAY